MAAVTESSLAGEMEKDQRTGEVAEPHTGEVAEPHTGEIASPCAKEASRPLSIEDYDVLHTAGKGRFSEVLKAVRNGTVCALKKFSAICMESEPLRKRVEEEIRLLQSLNHPNIIKHRAMFRGNDGDMYIELEWADGGDLKQLLRRHRSNNAHFAERWIWQMFVQIARGVNHMHANQIMHRDLKPANILVLREPDIEKMTIKIADLGLSKKISEITDEKLSHVGTPLYMAPEVLLREHSYSFSSDVWSMGCILYEMMCLVSPFRNLSKEAAKDDDDDLIELANRVTTADYPPIAEKLPYSRVLRDLVTKMIQLNPKMRFECGQVLRIAESEYEASASSLGADTLGTAARQSHRSGAAERSDATSAQASRLDEAHRFRPPALSIPGLNVHVQSSPNSAQPSPNGASWPRRFSIDPTRSPTLSSQLPNQPRSGAVAAPTGRIITGKVGLPISPRVASPRLNRLVPVGSAANIPRSPRSAQPAIPYYRSSLQSPRSAQLPRANTSSPQQERRRVHRRTVSDLMLNGAQGRSQEKSPILLTVHEASNSEASSATPGISDEDERKVHNVGARLRASLHQLSVATDPVSLAENAPDPRTAPAIVSDPRTAPTREAFPLRHSRLVASTAGISPTLKRGISLTPTANTSVAVSDLEIAGANLKGNSNPFRTESSFAAMVPSLVDTGTPVSYANPFSTMAVAAVTPRSALPMALSSSPSSRAPGRIPGQDIYRAEPPSGGFKFPLWANAASKKRGQGELDQDPLSGTCLPPGPLLLQPSPLDVAMTEEFPYILGTVVGEGSFAKVYRAVDPESGRSVAVKQMQVEISECDRATLAQMEKEIEFLKTLSHPNLVRYIDTKRFNNRLNIILEFCTEGSITSMLRMYKRFPEKLIRLYTKQMVEALIYLHERDIVHRDIKGGNVLVHGEGERGIVKLSDFGCSKKLGASKSFEKSSKMKGTVLWMAPEAVRQSPDTGTSSDIWSLGATIIEMATGKAPWTETGFKDEIVALLHIAQTTAPPKFPEEYLSARGINFLRCCMDIDPKKRSSAKQLALHDFLVLEQTSTVSTAEVGRKPDVVGASYNALRAAVKGRDLLLEREQVFKRRMRESMESTIQQLLTPRAYGTAGWQQHFARDLELSIPSVSIRLVGIPCVYIPGMPSSVVRLQGLTSVAAALDARINTEDESPLIHFVPKRFRNTTELIEVESRTAMWKWEITGSLRSIDQQTFVATGSVMATFDGTGQRIQTLEFIWDATGFLEKLALTSPTGSSSLSNIPANLGADSPHAEAVFQTSPPSSTQPTSGSSIVARSVA